MLVLLGSPKVSRVRLASMCTASLSLPVCIMPSLATIPLFIDLGRQRRTNTWSLKQRVCSAWWKQAFPILPSLVKMWVGRGNIKSSNQNTSYSNNEIWVTQHPCCFQNISSTNLHLRIFSLLNNKYNINSYNIKFYACSPLCQIFLIYWKILLILLIINMVWL